MTDLAQNAPDDADLFNRFTQRCGRRHLHHLDPQLAQQRHRRGLRISARQHQIGAHQENLFDLSPVHWVGLRLLHHRRGLHLACQMADRNQLARCGQQHGQLVGAKIYGHHPPRPLGQGR